MQKLTLCTYYMCVRGVCIWGGHPTLYHIYVHIIIIMNNDIISCNNIMTSIYIWLSVYGCLSMLVHVCACAYEQMRLCVCVFLRVSYNIDWRMFWITGSQTCTPVDFLPTFRSDVFAKSVGVLAGGTLTMHLQSQLYVHPPSRKLYVSVPCYR